MAGPGQKPIHTECTTGELESRAGHVLVIEKKSTILIGLLTNTSKGSVHEAERNVRKAL
jgi:hypothetical protein